MREQMHVIGHSSSETVKRALSDFGIEKSFDRAAQRFQEHYGWLPSTSTVRRYTVSVALNSQKYLEEQLKKPSCQSVLIKISN